MENIKCPICKYPLEIDVEFVIKNERAFCGTCCKAFDIKIQRTKEEKDPISEALLEKHFERKKTEEAAKEKKEEIVEEPKPIFDLDKGYYSWDGDF